MMQIPFPEDRSALYNVKEPLPGAQTVCRGEVQAGEELLDGYDLTGRFSFNDQLSAISSRPSRTLCVSFSLVVCAFVFRHATWARRVNRYLQ